MLKNTVLSKKVKIEFLGENAIFDQKLWFLIIFQIFQLMLRNSSFKQNGLFLHQNGLRNSIMIKLKCCLSIWEILDFALLRYPKKACTRTSARLILTVRNLAEVFGGKTTHFYVKVIRKVSFQAVTKNFKKISKIAILGQKSHFTLQN